MKDKVFSVYSNSVPVRAFERSQKTQLSLENNQAVLTTNDGDVLFKCSVGQLKLGRTRWAGGRGIVVMELTLSDGTNTKGVRFLTPYLAGIILLLGLVIPTTVWMLSGRDLAELKFVLPFAIVLVIGINIIIEVIEQSKEAKFSKLVDELSKR